MKLMFVGVENDPSEDAECVVGNTAFPRGEAVSVTAELFELLSTNSAFKVVVGKPGRPPKAAVEGTE